MTQVELPADMHCRSCEQRVERAVRALDGVSSVKTDLKRQQVAVEFDERRVDESEVEAAVAGAASHRMPGA
jgi:copper chaperone CopZ